MDDRDAVSRLSARCACNKGSYGLRIILAIGWLWWSGLVFAVSDNDFYRSGWAFYQDGRYQEAASLWQSQARSGVYPDQTARRQAAFAAVLATRAWERAENASAYAVWADAIRLYLEADTRWELERQQLAGRIAEARQALQQTTTPPTLEPFTQLLLTLDSESALADYSGPRPGLSRPSENTATEDLQVNYLLAPPVPAAVASQPAAEETHVGVPENAELVQPSITTAAPEKLILPDSQALAPAPADTPPSIMAIPESMAPANVEHVISQPDFSGHIIPVSEPPESPAAGQVKQPEAVGPAEQGTEQTGKKHAPRSGKPR